MITWRNAIVREVASACLAALVAQVWLTHGRHRGDALLAFFAVWMLFGGIWMIAEWIDAPGAHRNSRIRHAVVTLRIFFPLSVLVRILTGLKMD